MRAGEAAVNLSSVLGGTGDGVCAVNGHGRVTFWNRAAEQLLGYPAAEVLGRPCWDVLSGRDPAGRQLCTLACPVLERARRGETVEAFDLLCLTRAGEPRWLNVSLLRVPGADGELLVHVLRDVTVARALERLVRERLEARAAPTPDPRPPAPDLTRREREVLRLLAEGLETRAMAERLHLSPATVRNHVQGLLAKLGVHSRLQAVAVARRHGLA